MGEFSADSAYSYVARQVAFGPRVPGTASHDSCATWIETRMRAWADSVIVQKGTVAAFDGTVLPITNIIAGFNLPQTKKIGRASCRERV